MQVKAMENQPSESVVVSLPSPPVHRLERSEATDSMRKLWSTVTHLIRQLWSTVIYPIGQCCWLLISASRGDICEAMPPISDVELSPIGYIILGIIVGTIFLAHIILLPIKFTWKLLRRKAILTCIAVSLDPFFFYIPIINQENKCLGVDKKLRNTLLVLRSLTDFASVLHIVSQVRDWTIDPNPDYHTDTDSYFDSELRPTTSLLQKLMKSIVEAINGRMPWLSLSLVIDFLALLPIPQLYFSGGNSSCLLQNGGL
ncbi:uncharacterized protein LOC133724232 [Rosa rugosa]|uniref:uncharacterized protein LOC133724232 n=1 Tax=Rosa rugosa TaxID=74645 RepID=UPI002B416E70|nr:uncharacterized protein LOC133724232 [Rosa rugosa]